MAITYVGAGGTEPTTETTTTVTPPLPAGLAEGDLILVMYARDGTWEGTASTMPHPSATGYVRIAESRISGINGCLAKIAGASESDPSVVFPTAGSRFMARCVAYRGVDASIIDAPTLSEGGTGSVRKATDIRTNTDGAVAVAFRTMDNSSNTTAFSGGLDQGYTMRVSNPGTVPNCSLGIADKTVATADTIQTGPTFTQGNTGSSSVTHFVLLPDGADGSVRHHTNICGRHTTSTSLAVPIEGAASGDLVMVIAAVNSGVTINTPAGYTQIYNETEGGQTVAVFGKQSAGADTSVTVTVSAATNTFSVVTHVFQNVKFDSAADVEVAQLYSASSPLVAPPLTAAAAGRAVMYARTIGAFPALSVLQGFWYDWIWQAGAVASNRNEILAEKAVAAAGGVTFPTVDSGEDVFAVSMLLQEAASVPSAPTNPAAAAQSSSSILVTWDDVADETGYRVERSPDGTGSWVDVSGNLAAGTVSYLDNGLTAETQYFYRVIAFNASGDSSPSSTVNATTAAASGNRMGGVGAIRKPPRYS